MKQLTMMITMMPRCLLPSLAGYLGEVWPWAHAPDIGHRVSGARHKKATFEEGLSKNYKNTH